MVGTVSARAVTLALVSAVSVLVFVATSGSDTLQQNHPRTELYHVTGVGGRLPRGTWSAFAPTDSLMLVPNSKLRPTGELVPISSAHGWDTARLHRAVWIAVMRRSHDYMRVLLLKRSNTLAVCPGTWGLVGEHSEPGETWIATARRALVEELGIAPEVVATQRAVLMPGEWGEESVLVRTEYPSVQRRELQATAIIAVVLPESVADTIKPDSEVAEMSWRTYGELEALLRSPNHAKALCTAEIAKLLRLALDRLHENVPQQNNPREIGRTI